MEEKDGEWREDRKHTSDSREGRKGRHRTAPGVAGQAQVAEVVLCFSLHSRGFLESEKARQQACSPERENQETTATMASRIWLTSCWPRYLSL